jgi:hypothetical protein
MVYHPQNLYLRLHFDLSEVNFKHQVPDFIISFSQSNKQCKINKIIEHAC